MTTGTDDEKRMECLLCDNDVMTTEEGGQQQEEVENVVKNRNCDDDSNNKEENTSTMSTLVEEGGGGTSSSQDKDPVKIKEPCKQNQKDLVFALKFLFQLGPTELAQVPPKFGSKMEDWTHPLCSPCSQDVDKCATDAGKIDEIHHHLASMREGVLGRLKTGLQNPPANEEDKGLAVLRKFTSLSLLSLDQGQDVKPKIEAEEGTKKPPRTKKKKKRKDAVVKEEGLDPSQFLQVKIKEEEEEVDPFEDLDYYCGTPPADERLHHSVFGGEDAEEEDEDDASMDQLQWERKHAKVTLSNIIDKMNLVPKRQKPSSSSSRPIIPRSAKSGVTYRDGEEAQFQCSEPGCPQSFPTEVFRDAHYKRKHLGILACFTCVKCGRGFPRNSGLLFHLRLCGRQGGGEDPSSTGGGGEESPFTPIRGFGAANNTSGKYNRRKKKKKKSGGQSDILGDEELASLLSSWEQETEGGGGASSSGFNLNWSDLGLDSSSSKKKKARNMSKKKKATSRIKIHDDTKDEEGGGASTRQTRSQTDNLPKRKGGDDDDGNFSDSEEDDSDEEEDEESDGSGNGRPSNSTKVRKNNMAPVYGCFLCKIGFTTSSELEGHFLRSHSSDALSMSPVHYCHVCVKEFESLVRLEEHVGLNHRCRLCGVLLLKRDRLNRHIRYVHEKVADRKCEFCGALFIRADLLFYHILNSHHEDLGLPSLACSVCGTVKERPGDWKLHMEAKHPEVTLTKTKCPMNNCPKTFYHPGAYALHLRIGHVKHRIPCDECDRTFSARALLLHHKRSYHDPAGLGYMRKNLPNTLLRSEREKGGESSFVCEECGKTFLYASILGEHKITHHSRSDGKLVRRFGCEYCSSRFSLKGALTRHLKDKHGAAIYPQLPKSRRGKEEILAAALREQAQRLSNAPSPRELEEEERGKDYHCHLCPSRYAHNMSLRRHLRKEHNQFPLRGSGGWEGPQQQQQQQPLLIPPPPLLHHQEEPLAVRGGRPSSSVQVLYQHQQQEQEEQTMIHPPPQAYGYLHE